MYLLSWVQALQTCSLLNCSGHGSEGAERKMGNQTDGTRNLEAFYKEFMPFLGVSELNLLVTRKSTLLYWSDFILWNDSCDIFLILEKEPTLTKAFIFFFFSTYTFHHLILLNLDGHNPLNSKPQLKKLLCSDQSTNCHKSLKCSSVFFMSFWQLFLWHICDLAFYLHGKNKTNKQTKNPISKKTCLQMIFFLQWCNPGVILFVNAWKWSTWLFLKWKIKERRHYFYQLNFFFKYFVVE